MADKPTTLPEWASTEDTDPVSGQLNRVEPPTERKESGWTRREIPPRQWWNWLLWRIWQWLKWVDAGTHQATASTLMERDANGRSKAANPSASGDVVNRGWADGRYLQKSDAQSGYLKQWVFYDSPVEILLETVGSSADNTSPYENTFDFSGIAGVDENAQYLWVAFSMRDTEGSSTILGKMAWKKPSDSTYKWVIGAYSEISGADEPTEFNISKGKMQTVMVPLENGKIDVRAESSNAGNATVNINVIAEMPS